MWDNAIAMTEHERNETAEAVARAEERELARMVAGTHMHDGC
jgi:hypothetical protein